MDAEKDLIEVIALTSSTSLLLYGAARAAHKPGTSHKGENVLLAVAAGGLVASGLRLAAKSILKKQKHEDPHYFPALVLIRSVLRQSLRKDSLPRRSIQDSPVQPWRRVDEANIREHEERNAIYEHELKDRLHERAAQSKIREWVAASRGVSPDQVLVTSQAVDALLSAYCCNPLGEATGAIMVKAPSTALYEAVASMKGVDVIELSAGELDAAELSAGLSDRVKLIFLSSPPQLGGQPVSAEQIRAHARHASHALVVVDEAMAGNHQPSACSLLLAELPNLVVLQALGSDTAVLGGLRSVSSRAEVLLAREEVIVSLEARNHRRGSTASLSTHVGLLLGGANGAAHQHALDALHLHDEPSLPHHHKVLSAGPSSPTNSVMALEVAHSRVRKQHEKKPSILATAAGAVNKYL